MTTLSTWHITSWTGFFNRSLFNRPWRHVSTRRLRHVCSVHFSSVFYTTLLSTTLRSTTVLSTIVFSEHSPPAFLYNNSANASSFAILYKTSLQALDQFVSCFSHYILETGSLDMFLQHISATCFLDAFLCHIFFWHRLCTMLTQPVRRFCTRHEECDWCVRLECSWRHDHNTFSNTSKILPWLDAKIQHAPESDAKVPEWKVIFGLSELKHNVDPYSKNWKPSLPIPTQIKACQIITAKPVRCPRLKWPQGVS